MPTYAILGITGHVGGTAARKLLAAGEGVRAVVRSEGKAKLWRDRGAQAALASLDDPIALQAAFEGVDGAFLMTPTWSEAEDMFAENTKALKALGQASRNARLAKIVLLSSIGAEKPHGTGPIMRLHAMEREFADLPSVTSVRAAWFMENFVGLVTWVRETGVLPSMLAPLDRAIPMVATQDIGNLVAETLRSRWEGQRVINLEGPRRYSPHDVAEVFARVLARNVKAEILPETAWLSTYRSWGMTPRSGEAMVELLRGVNSGWISFDAASQPVRGTTLLDAVLSEAAAQPARAI